jgi:hypothetical protein
MVTGGIGSIYINGSDSNRTVLNTVKRTFSRVFCAAVAPRFVITALVLLSVVLTALVLTALVLTDVLTALVARAHRRAHRSHVLTTV